MRISQSSKEKLKEIQQEIEDHRDYDFTVDSATINLLKRNMLSILEILINEE
jgi:hypothetical protein